MLFEMALAPWDVCLFSLPVFYGVINLEIHSDLSDIGWLDGKWSFYLITLVLNTMLFSDFKWPLYALLMSKSILLKFVMTPVIMPWVNLLTIIPVVFICSRMLPVHFTNKNNSSHRHKFFMVLFSCLHFLYGAEKRNWNHSTLNSICAVVKVNHNYF